MNEVSKEWVETGAPKPPGHTQVRTRLSDTYRPRVETRRQAQVEKQLRLGWGR